MKRKLSHLVGIAILLLAAYGIYDIVQDIRNSYTSCYIHTYSRAVGQMMGPRFDALSPRGEGIRIGVVDAGFGGFLSDRFTRNLRVAGYLDLTDGDTTGFFRDDCNHGTRVTRNIGGFSNDTLLGLACKADYYLVKSDLEHHEPRDDERRLCSALEWLAEQQVDVVNISLGYTVFDDFDGYTPRMLDGRTALCSRFLDSLLRAHPNLVVVQSAGNEGAKKWRHIAFPADVEEAITVGAADAEGTRRSSKSGTGYCPHPVKPDLVVYDSPNGTSFSTPVVTGLCAVLLGCKPMERRSLIRLLHASGSRSTNPDLEMGYGIPQCDTLLVIMNHPDPDPENPKNATP